MNLNNDSAIVANLRYHPLPACQSDSMVHVFEVSSFNASTIVYIRRKIFSLTQFRNRSKWN